MVLSEQAILDCIAELKQGLALTERRLARLYETQIQNPSWQAYDKYTDAVVGVDVRIEEQEAVGQSIEQEIAKFELALKLLRAKKPQPTQKHEQAVMPLGVQRG